MGFLTLVLDGLKDATAFLLQGLSFLLKSLGKWTAIGFGKLFDKVFEIPKKILVWILKSLGFENMAKIVKDFSFKDVFLSILDHITSFLDILVEELKKISITKMAMDGLDHIFGFVETLWEKLKNVIGGFGDTLSDTFKHIKDAVSSLAQGDMNGVKESLMEAIKTVVRSILPPPGQSFTENPIAWIKGKVIPDSVYEWVGINPLTGGKTTARLANEFTQSVKDNGRDSIETRNASRAFKMERFRDQGREQGLKGLELEEYASNRYIKTREIQKAREAKMEKKVLPAPTLDVPAILGVGKKPEGITGVLSTPAGVGQGMTKEEEIKYMLHRLKDPSLAPEIRDEHIKTLNKLKVPIESIPKNTSGPLMQSTTMGGNITVINNNTTGDTRNYSANSNTNVSAVTAGMPVPAPSAMAGGH